MSFRARLTLAAAAAVAFAVVLASALVYFVVREELRAQVDDGLRERAEAISRIPLGAELSPETGEFFLRIPRPALGAAPGYVQVVTEDGATLRPPEEDVELFVTEHAREVARGEAESFFSDAHVGGTHVRVLTFAYGDGYAVQVTRPLTETDDALERIRLFLVLIALGGVGVAVALGLVVSRATLAPVRRLTAATERVGATRDLSERIDAGGHDELSRLAGSFNAMLGALEGSTRALEESARAQRQLVADASHELRTPLTSLRTNFEVLMGDRELPPDERRRLLDDVVEQIGEMTALISELIELARGAEVSGREEEVRLDALAAEAVERARRDRPGIVFSSDLAESTVVGDPESLGRAVVNLLDNAAKWSPPGGEVEVVVRDGSVVVRDHGPGIDDQDLPYVFDRFYRSPSARTLPGSGLGLAIVRQVAQAHGGEVRAERAEGGGTRVTLKLFANGARAFSSE
jgi:two-component system, OmpR family, sensor histidine kinase MprB